MAGSNKKLKLWGNERQKNENLGVFVLPHKSFSFGSIFITGTPNMEGKVLLRTDPSKTLPWEIILLWKYSIPWFWDFLSNYNYIDIRYSWKLCRDLLLFTFSGKEFTLKLAFGAWGTQINISALCMVYQTKY